MPQGSRMKSRLGVAAVTYLVAALLTQTVHAGGYVPPNGAQLKQATSISLSGSSNIIPTFNNATLTDQNTIAEANNNLIKTPLTSDPVSTVTGNNVHDETDFVIKGRAGLNYAFTRTYNSAPSATQTDLGLGMGWVHSYGMRLKSNDYGNCPNCTGAQAPENGNGKTSSITYTDERGGDHNYLVNETTFAVTPPQGEFDSLSLDTPAGTHTLTFRNGTRYVFQTVSGTLKTTPGLTARLVQIADPWGNQLNFAYNAAGRLWTVADNLAISGRSGLVFTYDASNHLQSIADWSGRTWLYSVTGSGSLAHLASFTNPLTQAVTYGYAVGTNNLTTIAKPLRGVATTFAYYQNGRTFNYRNALGNTETLDYDLYRKSTRVTDPRNGIREYEYDPSGRLTKLSEPDGAILMFQNQGDGLRYTKTDGLGYKTQYSYHTAFSFNTASDTFGNVTREQDALGQTIDTSYGIYDQVAAVKDKRGTVLTTTFYTGSGTCIAAGKPNTVTLSTLSGTANVKLKSYCWNSDGTLASQTDYLSPTDVSKARITTYTYDTAAHLNVQSLTVTGWDGVSVTQSFTYDTLGRKQTETLQRRISPTNAGTVALVTTTTWDAQDRAVQVQDAVGNLFINRFDANGQLWQVTHQYKLSGAGYDTRNVVTRSFDKADRVSTETDALGGVTSYSYDAAGNVTSVTDPENHTLQYQYDEMNRRTAVIDANGRSVRTSYDLAGHPISITNAANETASTAYDQIGRPLTVTDPHGYVSTFSFDANNNRTCAVDGNATAGLQPKNSDNCTVSTQYDELNRPVLTRDALNGVTQIAYDLLANPLSRIDAEGRRYTWTYDGLGRLTSETDVAGFTTSDALDQAGNAYQKTNRLAETTRITYDNLNRPTAISYLKDGTTEALGYDPAGNLASAANNSVGYSFNYDNLNRLAAKIDSRGRSLSFTWDKSGHILTKTTYQNSTTSYTYDGAGTLVSLSNPDYLTVNYQYDDGGRLLSRVMSSGARSLYGYDSGGWLQSLSHTDANGATVTSQSYTRDHVGNITGLNVTTGASPGATAYTYDALYRLVSADAPGTANDEAFGYDHVGNRLTATRGGTTIGAPGSTTKYSIYMAATQTGNPGYTASYNHRLSQIRIGSVGGTLDSGFGFDNEGRLTSQTGSTPRTLAWDAKGRLKTLTQGGSTETYAYDPSNHRIARSGGTVGNLDYFLEGEHLESVEQGGTLLEKYFRGSTVDELVAGYVMQGNKLVPYFFQHDQVMSVSAETKPNGGTQATLGYFAFGENQATTGTPISRLQFTGRENDGNGLYFYRARYYDFSIGRFISEDPLKFGAGANFYAYCNNSPIGCNDPMGLEGLTVVRTAPPGAMQIMAPDGQVFYAPKTVNFAAIYAAGKQGGMNPIAANNAIGQFGTFDFQRNASTNTFYRAYTDASNFAVGVYMNGAGFSPKETNLIGTAYAMLKSSNAGAPAQAAFWANGWNAANSNFVDPLESLKIAPSGPSYQPIGNGGVVAPLKLDQNFGPRSDLGGADGGFLIYPNKPNTNQIQSVYSK